MANISHNPSLKQHLTLAPQMRQSLKILQSSTLELRELVNVELNSNPMLEEIKPEEEIYSLSSQAGGPPYTGGAGGGARDFFFDSIPDAESFQEHIRKQANWEIEDPKALEAFNFLADFLDERGFLPELAKEEAIDANIRKKDAESAIKFMQSFSPSGIGAKNVWESFLIQLAGKNRKNSIAYAILENHSDLLEKRKVPEMARALMTTEANIEKAIKEIASLDPSPAKTFSSETSRLISEDLVFKKTGGAWTVGLTSSHIPKLRINSAYRDMIAKGRVSRADLSYIKEKTREGKFIIGAIEQRQHTILSIGKIILEKQKDFFESNIKKPMTMAEVAETIGVNPTTVSRAVSEKYARIGFRLFPLKDFFSGGYATNAHGGETIASSCVKEKIRAIVEGESPKKPLSDNQIADALKKENIDIARRTVAKYREELNIPAKILRKRY